MNFSRLTTYSLLLAGIATEGLANPANPAVSFILDGFYKSENTALSEREDSFGLGHTELSLQSAVNDRFTGRLTTVLESHDGETEVHLEEAFFNSIGLPLGLDVRGGRFLSQIGYLNAHHTHSDAFAERPAAYRALLGTHYFDDGLRVNALLPTPFFWQVGVEAFKGTQFAGGEGDESIGVYTFNTKIGGDFSESNSWQVGLSYLNNKLTASDEHGHEDEHDEEEEHAEEEHGHDEHGHSHGASYTGENLYIADFVWKWAPKGYARNQQLVVSAEYLLADDIGEHASSDDVHEGWYASMVYRFHPQWSVGLRHGEIELKEAHDDHFHDQDLEETDLMLAWSHSHFSTVRLQYSRQDGTELDDINDAVTLQYVMTLGAHGAHAF